MFYPKTTSKPPDNHTEYQRQDFITALTLDSTGVLPSSPAGDDIISGNVNQKTTESFLSKPGLNKNNHLNGPNVFSRPTQFSLLYLKNLSGDPASTPVTGGYVYTKAGALYYKGSSGTVTKIANA